jgi:hypothetical protein
MLVISLARGEDVYSQFHLHRVWRDAKRYPYFFHSLAAMLSLLQI